MPCSNICKTPTPSQAHCGACHETFNGVRGFDAHRREGVCLPPLTLGMAVNPRGVWSWPLTEERREQLAVMRGEANS